MTDRQLRSLSKKQMLSLLRQQENELERMANEITNPHREQPIINPVQSGFEALANSLPATAALLDEIIRSAQEAADSYVRKVKDAEEKRMISITQMEAETKRRLEEAEKHRVEVITAAKKAINDICTLFEWQINQLTTLYTEFQKALSAHHLINLIPTEQRHIPE